ncbi:MOSC domain-containing protein [Noviherbaspirillum suwonense]|jgi:MOSC domain-containing protein YiiM|uniref:MOSC domain-containing protein YiiM n=1 Tax=Noviherbaspirillum suwonense TaxID=1224511 RepID=A0ABY1QAX1_9BURK|nr:MOSC domain-containing protein [Noviherbaspirillum suwonense]SMP64849.1 MOSC domain-containing protein YiiM [Noviherbaspirillum suwonense]
MKLISVNVAQVGPLFGPVPANGRQVATAIHKQPVAGPVAVGRLGLDGDAQADRRLHGGPGKAVYAYPLEHYAFWQTQRRLAGKGDAALVHGALGENLTVQGLLEDACWIGDRLAVGTALLEVSEVRTPCFKLNVKMGLSHAARLMDQSGHTGFYLRVLRPGMIAAGDAVTVLPGPRSLTIAQINAGRRTARQPDLF